MAEPAPARARRKPPVSTVTTTGAQQAVVSAGLVNLKGSERRASAIEAPHPTVTAQGTHSAEVRAFLVKYYGNEKDGVSPAEPLHTIPTRDRFGLVMVNGEPYEIADIGMRMLTRRELFRAQGFPDSYQIERGHDGRVMTQSASIRMCGDSVSPVMARALVAANYIPDQKYEPEPPGANPPPNRPQPFLRRSDSYDRFTDHGAGYLLGMERRAPQRRQTLGRP
jgi:DNA (cytosine-5)-methyltransferase 1